MTVLLFHAFHYRFFTMAAVRTLKRVDFTDFPSPETQHSGEICPWEGFGLFEEFIEGGSFKLPL